MSQTITPIPYTLTLDDIRDYLATLDEEDGVAIPKHCYRCLGAETLRWKYAFRKYQVRIAGTNSYSEVVETVALLSIGHYDIPSEVETLLDHFDELVWDDERFPLEEDADTWPLVTKAELRANPDFAVLFAPPVPIRAMTGSDVIVGVAHAPEVSTAALPLSGGTPRSTQPIQQANLPQWVLSPQVAKVIPPDGMEPVHYVETRTDDERIREQLLCLPADMTFSAESVARMCGYTEDDHKEGLVQERMKKLRDASRVANDTVEHFVVVPGSRGQEMRWE